MYSSCKHNLFAGTSDSPQSGHIEFSSRFYPGQTDLYKVYIIYQIRHRESCHIYKKSQVGESPISPQSHQELNHSWPKDTIDNIAVYLYFHS